MGRRHRVAPRQRQRRDDGARALGDHARLALDRRGGAALRERHAELSIAGQASRAGEHEIAEPGQPGHGPRDRAQSDRQTRHLGEPARHERGARVLAEPEAVGDSGRDGHDVLQRAADLDADHVAVGVEPELAGAEPPLERGRQGVVAASRSPRRSGAPAPPRARTSGPTARPRARSGNRSAITSLMRRCRSGSRPFVADRIGTSAGMDGSVLSVVATNSDGTTMTDQRGAAQRPPPRRSWAPPPPARRCRRDTTGSGAGREFRRRPLRSRAQRRTGEPARATWIASAVPQLPPPMTAMLTPTADGRASARGRRGAA